MKVCPNDECPHLLSAAERAEYVRGDHCAECQTLLVDADEVEAAPVGAERGTALFGVNIAIPDWLASRLIWSALGVVVFILGLVYDAATATATSELVIVNGTDVILHVDAEDVDHHHESFVVPLARMHRLDAVGDLTIEVVDGHGRAIGEYAFENPGNGISVINPGSGRALCRTEHTYLEHTSERVLTEPVQVPIEGDVLHFEAGTRVFRRPLDRADPGSPAATTVGFCHEG